ncbi:hypothetical protein HPB51_016879 [Rhipicephalus microplus]|uniref:Uncharacterized protein n=1 Tax=Rhipicephalus microplus TaxID=6941 RepID=A0A9J6DAB6_RHIMP|nr:hypothetical protein HPB51_016879 [Rhipicephalus microplus]
MITFNLRDEETACVSWAPVRGGARHLPHFPPRCVRARINHRLAGRQRTRFCAAPAARRPAAALGARGSACWGWCERWYRVYTCLCCYQHHSDRLAVERELKMSPREFSWLLLSPAQSSCAALLFPGENNGICRRVYSSVKTALAEKHASPSLRPAGTGLFSQSLHFAAPDAPARRLRASERAASSTVTRVGLHIAAPVSLLARPSAGIPPFRTLCGLISSAAAPFISPRRRRSQDQAARAVFLHFLACFRGRRPRDAAARLSPCTPKYHLPRRAKTRALSLWRRLDAAGRLEGDAPSLGIAGGYSRRSGAKSNLKPGDPIRATIPPDDDEGDVP